MQTLAHKNIKIIYVLITEQLSFIPDNILNRSQIIPFKRPTKLHIISVLKRLKSNVDLSKIKNIKNIISDIQILDNMNQKIIDKIVI